MSIPFTQFLMPDGRQKQVEIDRPREIEDMAKAIIEAGYAFEIEMLSTGQISMETCREEDVLAAEICRNGPPVVAAVDKVVRDAFTQLAETASPSQPQ